MQTLGITRQSHDLDVWVSHTGFAPDQVHAVLYGLIGENADSFKDRLGKPGKRFVIPSPGAPEIDILTSVGDLDFDQIFAASRVATLGPSEFRIPERNDLIRTKKGAIASLEERIAAGNCVGEDLANAKAAVARDTADIALISALR